MEERRRLEGELAEARRKLATGEGDEGSRRSRVSKVGDVDFKRSVVAGLEMRDLKPVLDEEKKRIGSGVIAIIGVAPDGRAGIVVGVTDDLTARFDAVTLVRAGAAELGGKGGGGRRDMAQAGGPDGGNAEAALAAVEAALQAA
jgi:alanyl-tRNA synthetase